MSKSVILFSDLATELWKKKFLYCLLIIIVNVSVVLFTLSLPNKYKASTVVVSVNDSSNLGGQAGLGGLAALAGVNLSNNSTEITSQALIYLRSRDFINSFINKYNLMVELFAIKSWQSGELTYNDKLYNYASKEWLKDEKGSLKPTKEAAHKEFLDLLEIDYEESEGFLKLSIIHYSPEISAKVANLLIEEINSFMEKLEIKQATDKMSYLLRSMETEPVVEVNTLLSDLYEEQYKKKMLASINDGYVFRFVDRAIVPEAKVSPKRSIICIIGFIFSILLCFTISTVKLLLTREK